MNNEYICIVKYKKEFYIKKNIFDNYMEKYKNHFQNYIETKHHIMNMQKLNKYEYLFNEILLFKNQMCKIQTILNLKNINIMFSVETLNKQFSYKNYNDFLNKIKFNNSYKNISLEIYNNNKFNLINCIKFIINLIILQNNIRLFIPKNIINDIKNDLYLNNIKNDIDEFNFINIDIKYLHYVLNTIIYKCL